MKDDSDRADDKYESDGGIVVEETMRTTQAALADTTVARQLLAVAANEYRLAIRRRWAIALAALFAAFGVAIVVFGTSAAGPIHVGAIVVSLASLATYLVPLAALAFGYDAVVGSEDAGWLEVLFALPVARSTIVVGTYLGRAVALCGAILIGFGVTAALLVSSAGLASWSAYLAFLLGAVGMGAAFLSIAVLVSTVAAAKTHALGVALSVWVWFAFVHDLVALGVAATVRLPDAILTAFVVSNPATTARVLVLSSAETASTGSAPLFAEPGVGTPLLVAALLAWSAVPALAAGKLVQRRDV